LIGQAKVQENHVGRMAAHMVESGRARAGESQLMRRFRKAVGPVPCRQPKVLADDQHMRRLAD
jgi:hypothetical protein